MLVIVLLLMLEFQFYRHRDLPGSEPDWAFARNRLAEFLPFVHPTSERNGARRSVPERWTFESRIERTELILDALRFRLQQTDRRETHFE